MARISDLEIWHDSNTTYCHSLATNSNAFQNGSISQEQLVRFMWNEKKIDQIDNEWTVWPLTSLMTLTLNFSRSNFGIVVSQELLVWLMWNEKDANEFTPPMKLRGVYGFHFVCLSICPSVCRPNHVRSVSFTILAVSISYLHILSNNFRRCAVHQGCLKNSKINIFADFFSWLSTSCFGLWMWDIWGFSPVSFHFSYGDSP